MTEDRVSRELGEIYARLNAIDSTLDKCDFKMTIEALTKAQIVEDRLDRHLLEIKNYMSKIEEKVDIVLEKNHTLEISQTRQEGKFMTMFAKHGGIAFFGGGLSNAIIELIKMLKNKG